MHITQRKDIVMENNSKNRYYDEELERWFCSCCKNEVDVIVITHMIPYIEDSNE